MPTLNGRECKNPHDRAKKCVIGCNCGKHLGHGGNKKLPRLICLCGCGEQVYGAHSKYKSGHNNKTVEGRKRVGESAKRENLAQTTILKKKESLEKAWKNSDVQNAHKNGTKKFWSKPENHFNRSEKMKEFWTTEKKKQVGYSIKVLRAQPEIKEKVKRLWEDVSRKEVYSKNTKAQWKKMEDNPKKYKKWFDIMSRAQTDAWKDPVKRRNRLEGIKKARPKQRASLLRHWGDSERKEITLAKSRATLLERYGSVTGPKVDTKPELKVKHWLDSKGLIMGKDYFHPKPIKGILVDFYIPKTKHVIEVDGCYYHGHDCKARYINAFPKNKIRDEINTEKLLKFGYRVTRLWDCQLEKILTSGESLL